MEQKIFGLIYKITNLINGKIYIGQTTDMERRTKQHLRDSRLKKPKSVIGKAIKKHGWENFTVDIRFNAFDADALNEAEKSIIKDDKSTESKIGYNLREGGMAASGWCHSDATKAKLSLSHIGLTMPCSEETKAKIGLANKGRTRTNESKTKMSLSARRRTPVSEEAKHNMSLSQKGKTHSEQTRQKISLAHKDKMHSKEHTQKLAEACNKPVSQLSLNGEVITTYASLTKAYHATGVDQSGISKCCKGKVKSAGGFRWCYKEDSNNENK